MHYEGAGTRKGKLAQQVAKAPYQSAHCGGWVRLMLCMHRHAPLSLRLRRCSGQYEPLARHVASRPPHRHRHCRSLGVVAIALFVCDGKLVSHTQHLGGRSGAVLGAVVSDTIDWVSLWLSPGSLFEDVSIVRLATPGDAVRAPMTGLASG